MLLRNRLILAVCIGLISGVACYLRLEQRNQLAADFTFPWRAAQLTWAGENPYTSIQPTGEYPFQTYFYYPLTSALAALPLAWLPAMPAGALFFGISAGLLAFALSREGWKRLAVFASAPFWVALAVAQWSPLLVAASLLPWTEWLLACKPNLGAAMFLYNPSKRGLALLAGFVGLSLLVQPGWPLDWLAVTRKLAGHPPPFLAAPYGFLLLLALLRWREPEGRLFLGIAILPQLLFFYDQLPLWLVARGWKSGLILSGLSWLAYFAWRWRGIDPASGEVLAQPTHAILLLIYLPALALLLWPRGKARLPAK